MATGLPWRIYLSLRNANLSFLNKEKAKKHYAKSIEQIKEKFTSRIGR